MQMWATSIQLFAYSQGYFNKLLLNRLMQKKKRKKKKGCRTQKLGFLLKKKKVITRCIQHFWKMVVTRWLWIFKKKQTQAFWLKHYGRSVFISTRQDFKKQPIFP